MVYNYLMHTKITKKSCIFLLAILLSLRAGAHLPSDSWDVVRHEFTLDHQLNQPEVQQQITWLISHPKYLNQLNKAKPYIYHIITEIQKRHIPGELALIPMIESAYNPFAYSGAGAAGLWQLMPATGRHLGVKGDWWVDGRRSINDSTAAALKYFQRLNNIFKGDWLLAIAAYDCGEGTILRLLKQVPNYERSIWYLNLPQETKIYVPRLLALAEIIAHPQKYHVNLPFISHQPFFTEVSIIGQLDLNHAAKLAGVDYQELLKLNPGFNHWSTSPNNPKLLVPVRNAAQFSKNLAQSPTPASFAHHLVVKGDTLETIARRYHTQPQLIAKINAVSQAITGSVLDIPVAIPSTKRIAHTKPINPKHYKIIHIVQKNDSIASICKKYQISSNSLDSKNLTPGQKLIIWKNASVT